MILLYLPRQKPTSDLVKEGPKVELKNFKSTSVMQDNLGYIANYYHVSIREYLWNKFDTGNLKSFATPLFHKKEQPLEKKNLGFYLYF